MIFERPRLGTLKLSESAASSLLSFRQLEVSATEAGGVLVGRHILGTVDVVIDLVTTPMQGDRRTRTSFHRARARHQAVLDREWKISRGTRVYLGEWHTHPERVPQPSSTDLDDWQRRLRRDTVEAPFVFFLIVGQDEVRGWEGSRTSYGVAPLRRQPPRVTLRDSERVQQ